MPDLAKLSASRLRAIIERRSDNALAATRAAINAGMGDIRFDEMRRLASSDPVATSVVATWESEREARDELKRRNEWHGSDKPIKRAA